MKLRGSLFSLGMTLTLVASQAGAQEPMLPPRGPAPLLPNMAPNMAMGSPNMPVPGTSAFPPNVATLAPDGTPAPVGDVAAAGGAPAPHYGLPGITLPFFCGDSEPECCPEFMPFPTMIGDVTNTFGTRIVGVRTLLADATPDPFTSLATDEYLARVPIVTRGAFKIAECESPQPQSRFYYHYTYYTDVRASFSYVATLRKDLDGANQGAIIEVPGPVQLTTFKEVRVRRDTIGFECAIPDRLASFGMRVSFIDVIQDVSSFIDLDAAINANDGDASTVADATGFAGALDHSEVSDITLIGKVALLLDYATGDVVSVGLAATIPTGHGFTSALDFQQRKLHPTLLQPFVGYLFTSGDWYLHGFTSGIVPTDSRDVYFVFNDIGIGWWCYKNECADNLFINGIVPTLELHVTTPVRNSGIDENNPVGAANTVVMTAGCHVFTFGWASITGGVGTVLSGPKPYDVEVSAQFNLRF